MRLPDLSRRSILTLIAVVTLASIGAVVTLTQKERARDLAAWQEKLNLIADTSTRDVDGWVEKQFSELNGLASNTSFQIYFMTLKPASATAKDAMPPAQAEYLSTLLTFTAQRLGFQSAAPAQVKANVTNAMTGGLAVVNNNGEPLMATSGMPPLEASLLDSVKQAPRGKATLIDISQTADGSQRIGFIVPIYGIQADHTAAGQVGAIVGVRTLDAKFFALLSPSSKTEKTLEVALVRTEGEQLHYLTPLLDNSPVMAHREANTDASLAAAYAAKNPNGFSQRTDYRGHQVLVTGRAIANTPWTLIAKIDRDEALAPSIAWRNTIMTGFALLVVAVSSLMLAVWRHASARRSALESAEAQAMARESNARATLLSLVTNHQMEPLYIVDEAQTVCFANQAAAESMNSSPENVLGKSLNNASGHAFAAQVAPYCAQVLASGKAATATLTHTIGTATRTLITNFVPLKEIPLLEMAPLTRGVLITEQDMTNVIEEREKRMHTLNQLIAMLVSLVDRRDPHASKHSAFVAKIAAHTAQALNLDETMIDTTVIAAQLMNLGKMDIPAELLTRNGALTAQDQATIRSSLATSASLIEGIEFNGPVTETLKQAQEHIDGSGPLALKGDAILISARIIAAANALVGMLSPRSYRKPMSMEDAIKTLFVEIDSRFDRKIVVAIVNYLDNHAGREELQSLQSPQANVA